MDIYSCIRKDIEDNVYQSDQRLPSESELTKRFNVKRFAVRKAIEKLIQDGFVYAIRNKGYYVKKNEILVRIRKESNYTQSMISKKMTPRVRLLELKTVSPSSEQKELFDLKDDDKLWEIYIIRYYKNIPYVLGKSYIPYHRVPDFNTHYQRSLSIYTVLEKIYGIKPSRSSSECKVTMSDKRESRLLSIFDHSPLLKVTSLNEDQNKAVIEQCISKFRADIVQLTIKLQ
ncbi:MAG: GntR family transcriptional regulator [Thermotaleaceae bacterium]